VIGRLTGVLLEKNPPQVLLDVSGVGYEVEVPMSTFYNLPANGERVTLHTQFIVREDAQLLYGFATERERATFRQLLKVNGIGAKSALGILSGLSVDDLAQAITLQEPGLLTRIPGIGKKTAERLLLELKDKLGAAIATTSGGAATPNPGHDTLNALLALGYNEREALSAVKQLPPDLSVSEGIRQALKTLAKG
jgi:Holliday junction DNA helicase RuvA